MVLSDSYIVPECAIRPGSFGGLMALYESNFIKLTHLFGQTDFPADVYFSRAPGDCDLRMHLDACTKYTRVVRMTYLFEDESGQVAEPDLSIKMYLDARMTEVLGWANQHRHAFLSELVERFSRELDRRWTCNMMLGKWLDYLIDRGHAFDIACPLHTRAVEI